MIIDINEIYSRIFHHRQFLTGEINYFLKEFEVGEIQSRSCDNIDKKKKEKHFDKKEIAILIWIR